MKKHLPFKNTIKHVARLAMHRVTLTLAILLTVSVYINALADKIIIGAKHAIFTRTKSDALDPINISYPATNVFIAGNSALVNPTSTGVATAAYGAPVTLTTNFVQPIGVLADNAGNVYVADRMLGTLIRMADGSTTQIPVGNSMATPYAMAIDKAHNIYVANEQDNTIKKIPAGGANPGIVGFGFSAPTGVAVDAQGNIYVADSDGHALKKIPFNSNTPVSVLSNSSITGFTPISVAIDSGGNIYVSDPGNKQIVKIPAGGGAPVVVSTGYSSPSGITTDNAGNVFVADFGDNKIKKVDPNSLVPVTVVSTGLNGPFGVSADKKGRLFVADYNSHSIKVITPVGGYYATVPLPAGLSMNVNTGTISGIPTIAAPPLQDTIFAYNANNYSAVTLSIEVKAFAPAVVSYSSPNSYVVGKATTPLTPVSTGVAPPAYLSTASVIAAGFTSSTSMAADQDGSLYIVDGNGSVINIPANGIGRAAIGDGLVHPAKLAVGADHDVYIYDSGPQKIKKFHAGTTDDYFTLPGPAAGLAVDGGRNMYVSIPGLHMIMKGDALGIVTTLTTAVDSPAGLAVDASGNLYIGDLTTHSVLKLPASGGPPVTIAGNIGSPANLAVDQDGNLFVADDSNGVLKKIAAGNSPVPLVFGGGLPAGVTADGAGNVYVVDKTSGEVRRISPQGGYFITPALPEGLSFDWATGTISGTPVAATPPAMYTVTAWNPSGSSITTLNIATVLPPKPSISYNMSQTFAVGTNVTLAPTASNVAPAGGYNKPFVKQSPDVHFPTIPQGVAVDGAGNIFVATGQTYAVELPADGSVPVLLSFDQVSATPTGVALDAAGNVYMACADHTIKEFLAGTTTDAVTLESDFQAFGVAVDANNNLYATDTTNHAVKKLLPGATSFTTITSSLISPRGIATDAGGNVYVTDIGNNTLYKFPLLGLPSALSHDFNMPLDVEFDIAGNYYVVDQLNRRVKKVMPDGTSANIGAGFGDPRGVAISNKGVVYVADAANKSVMEIDPSGGYFISPALPKGLTLDKNTGVISGVPVNSSPATKYTVTAYNAAGSSSADFTMRTTATPVAIAYDTPDEFTVSLNAPVTVTQSPAKSTGVAPFMYSATQGILTTGLGSPVRVATDSVNNLYIADAAHSYILKIPADGSPAVQVGSYSQPLDVTVDGKGNIYVCDAVGLKVWKMDAAGNNKTLLASGFTQPAGIALDGKGYLYIADNAAGITKVPVTGGAQVPVGTGWNSPVGIKADQNGNLFVAEFNVNTLADVTTIKKLAAGTNTPVPYGSGFTGPVGITIDAGGNVFVTDVKQNKVFMIPPGNGTPVLVGAGFGTPYGIAVDTRGILYVADYGNGRIKSIRPAGGYFLSTPLPAGWVFDNNTGNITATPTVPMAAKNYTVTAYNATDTASAVVNIKVIAITNLATLSHLALSSGTLSPAFAAGTLSYTANVANTVSMLKVTPTATDNGATIKVNGVAVTSGTASASLPLSVGANTVTLIVKASDGTTTKTYTIKVTRAEPGGSADALLSSLKISPATPLTVVSGPGYQNYTTAVPNSESSIRVTPAGHDATSTIRVNGTVVASGVSSAAIPLAVGSNVITTIVTAQDGTTTKSYIITVTRAAAVSADALLSSLKISPATPLTSVSGPGYQNYTTAVLYSESSIKVIPTGHDATSTIRVNGTVVASGISSAAIPLAVGSNVITTVVTAQDGVTTKSYIITITRATGSTDALLSTLKISPATPLTVVSGPGYQNYTTSVPNSESSIKIIPAAHDVNSTIRVNGTVVTSGVSSAPIPLAVGSNVITTVVTAQDGVTTKSYIITLTRAPGSSADALLSTLKITPATPLTTVSGSNYRDYTTTAPNSETTVKITPTAHDASATIKVNGVAVASGTASASLPLIVGDNVINTVVTASDGVTTKTYSLKITRAPATMEAAYQSPDTLKTANDGITVHPGLSPNGDGISDVLQIDGITNYPDNTFQVINRSGVLVYSVKGYDNVSKVFDGQSNINGKMQQPGTYFYRLEYTADGKTKFKTGFIVIKY